MLFTITIIEKNNDVNIITTNFKPYITHLISVFAGKIVRLHTDEFNYINLLERKPKAVYINNVKVYRKKILGIF